AEDGIRDDLVTGVQTCALPISAREPLEESQHRVGDVVEVDQRVAALEVATLWLRRPSAVLHRGAPLAAPRPVDLDPVGEVLALQIGRASCRESRCLRAADWPWK